MSPTREKKRRGGLSGGSRSASAYGEISDESSSQRKRRRDLHKYYQSVIERLAEADDLYFFGPAQARSELAAEIARGHDDLNARIRQVEAADEMTEGQIVAHAREFYHEPNRLSGTN